MISELMLSVSKTALLRRPDVPEDTMTIDGLELRGNIKTISVEELKDIGKIIVRMEDNNCVKTNYLNRYKRIVQSLISQETIFWLKYIRKEEKEWR